jgi:hypothetical protein
MLRGRWSFLLLSLMIIISLIIFIPSFPSTTSSIFQTATAAQPLSAQSSSSLDSTAIKIILSDSIQALKSGNTSKTLEHLNVLDYILTTVKENSPSIQTTRLLISDAIQAVRGGDTNKALIHLNLADQQQQQQQQQLTTQFPNNKTSPSSSQTNTNIPTTNNYSLSAYDNPNLGIRMRYPSNWSVIENSYNSTTNNTVARFLSPSKTSSELGNVSGVSGNFVPYLDIFVFDSKNMSLDQIVNGIYINYFSNNSDFAIHESKPFALDNGSNNNLNNSNKQPAYILDYSAKVGGDELFRKMQVYTISNSKVFVITFTSQQALFPNYMPIVQKMINSFVFQNTSTLK